MQEAATLPTPCIQGQAWEGDLQTSSVQHSGPVNVVSPGILLLRKPIGFSLPKGCPCVALSGLPRAAAAASSSVLYLIRPKDNPEASFSLHSELMS